MGNMIDRSNRFFGGPEYTKFEDAFPQVKSIIFKYHVSGRSPVTLTKETMICPIPCPNDLCTEGGFEIDTELALHVFSKRLKQYTGIISCSGHEHMGSRWKTRSCFESLTYEVCVEYHDDKLEE